MNDMKWPNLAAMFFQQAAVYGDKPFLWKKKDGRFCSLDWAKTAKIVCALAKGLERLGISEGDRVVIVSENRPEWLIADIAIMSIGAITVPAYITNTSDDHLHILNDSAARGAIVSTAKLAENLLPAAARSSTLEFVVSIENDGGEQTLEWSEILDPSDPDKIVEQAKGWGIDHIACIIYTSGTGGAPKGVMLHHGAILHNCRGALDAISGLGLGNEVFLSFLPLSHSLEHTAGQFFPVSIGAEIYYAEGIDKLSENMIEARPTIMLAVPRMYEMMHGRIIRAIKRQGGIKQKLFLKALELGRIHYQNPQALGPIQRLADIILDKLVRDKFRAGFGGRMKAMISGGAPLNPDIGIFFTALGLLILQGYGQTESAPVISVNRPGKIRMDTVGEPLKEVNVKIAEDGEILVRGELVMKGYWQNPEATEEAIHGGWLHTGDIGVINDDGTLVITDRKKDIIVNSGGDNISPQRIEGLLTIQPEIHQAMVYGDRQPHLVALLVPDTEWVRRWATENSRPDMETLACDKDFCNALGAAVKRVNATLSNTERIRRQIITFEPFSIENEQLTPTMKIRRHIIKEIYGKDIEALYGSNSA